MNKNYRGEKMNQKTAPIDVDTIYRKMAQGQTEPIHVDNNSFREIMWELYQGSFGTGTSVTIKKADGTSITITETN